jgi:CheY-like chemotaxis protein
MKKKVLLVDDTETVLMFERMLLRGSGFETEVARNGVQALEQVAKDRPDLILLDIMMPVMDGIETCRRLKSNPATKNIPVFIVTTKGADDMVEQAFEAGCDDFLTKPIDKLLLLKKMKSYFSDRPDKLYKETVAVVGV